MDHLPTYLENLDTFPAILSTSGPSAFLRDWPYFGFADRLV
jgi:hypothetical protein